MGKHTIGATSTNSGDGECDEENYQSILGKILQEKRKVGVAQRDFQREKPSHSTKKVTRSLLQDELDENESSVEIKKIIWWRHKSACLQMTLCASGT